MPDNRKKRVRYTEHMLLISVVLAVVYLLLDSFLAIFHTSKSSLFEQVMGFNIDEISMRIIALCLFAIFGSHAQYTINERKKAAEKMENDALMRERFQRLLSPDLAEMVVSGELNVEKGGEDHFATVLFVDIRGFTTLSENAPASDVLQMLNEYFECIVDVVFRHEGTVDKFIGDEMMVIWGAPMAHENDPVRAVRAALDIQETLAVFNEKRILKNLTPISVGIGINTGNLMAGYIGSTRTMSYSVIGDTVNTASRICAAARAGQIIISEQTYRVLHGEFTTREMSDMVVKGKFNPVHVHEVIGYHDA
ncbi:MAG: adenylate/guanylate cyclase domain-containing protein [Desulfobacteraceae bacterium]|nr:adenylate/guanylate cyclase domain-containing protein [Desulfobacteraceae bacterium]